jgi:hypothetical protein
VFGQHVTFGTIYCDQTISFLAAKQGLQVHNPCLSVDCEHLHQSAVRNRPGTREHRVDRSSSSDGLEGQTVAELERRLTAVYGLRLMAFSRFGGGLIWPSKLVADQHRTSPHATVSCRRVARWQPVRRIVKHVRRAALTSVGLRRKAA